MSKAARLKRKATDTATGVPLVSSFMAYQVVPQIRTTTRNSKPARKRCGMRIWTLLLAGRRHGKVFHQKCILIGDFLDLHPGGFAGAMPGAGFNPGKYWIIAALRPLQCGSKFETVPGDNPVVMIRCINQRGRITRTLFYIMVGRIGEKRLEHFFAVFTGAVITGPAMGI